MQQSMLFALLRIIPLPVSAAPTKTFPSTFGTNCCPRLNSHSNLLQSCINPKLSAWAQLHRPFDFNQTPIAPTGIHILIHEKPSTHRSWAPHGIASWHLSLALKSYQSYTIWVTKTWVQQICHTLTCLPTKTPMPSASPLTRCTMVAPVPKAPTPLRVSKTPEPSKLQTCHSYPPPLAHTYSHATNLPSNCHTMWPHHLHVANDPRIPHHP